MSCTGNSGFVNNLRSRCGSCNNKFGLLYVAKRLAKPIVNLSGSNKCFALSIVSDECPDPSNCLEKYSRANSIRDFFAFVRNSQSFSSETRRIPFSSVSFIPSQRSLPQNSVHTSSASFESQVGMCTPFVICPTGTSFVGHLGNKGSKI